MFLWVLLSASRERERDKLSYQTRCVCKFIINSVLPILNNTTDKRNNRYGKLLHNVIPGLFAHMYVKYTS